MCFVIGLLGCFVGSSSGAGVSQVAVVVVVRKEVDVYMYIHVAAVMAVGNKFLHCTATIFVEKQRKMKLTKALAI